MKNITQFIKASNDSLKHQVIAISASAQSGEDYDDELARYQPIRLRNIPDSPQVPPGKSYQITGCVTWLLFLLMSLLVLILGYSFLPGRVSFLILGIDDRAEGGVLGRSDTMILATVSPVDPYVGLFSVPRDLWVSIPGKGENRINTAHFFAEAELPGSGPQAALRAVELNFNLPIQYYIRFRFDSFKSVVDVLGGVDIDLPEATSGYPAGTHRLNADQALAFVRDRSGSDDFFRMERGRLMIISLLREALIPRNWRQFPKFVVILAESLDTNLPVWQAPRIAIGLMRVGLAGIDSRGITREMVMPFTTTGGAQVLAPNWELINPVLAEMFAE